MSSLNYTKATGNGSRAPLRRMAFGPYTAGRDVSFTVPAGVTTVYVTGCAQGGTSFSSAISDSVFYAAGHAVFDGTSYLFLSPASDPNSAASRTALNKTAKHEFGDAALTWRYFGKATGASAAGLPFIVSGGAAVNGTGSAGISWSTDGGYTFAQRPVANLCAKQVVVSNDGRAVVLWAAASGSQVVLSATKDFGASWQDFSATAFGDVTNDVGTLSFINNTFVIGVAGAGRYRYAIDPTGGWSTIVTGGTGDGCSVAWDGSTYIWGSAAGEVHTSTSLTGPFTVRTTQFSATSPIYVVAGQNGNFVAHTSNSTGATVVYSINSGSTWTTSITTSSVQYANGGLVYSEALGQFVLQGTSAGASARSVTGAAWTSLSNGNIAQGRPTAWNHYGYRVLCKLPSGVFCGQYSLTSPAATAWSSGVSVGLLGFPPLSVDGSSLQIFGSSSGFLLALKGGKGQSTPASGWATGANGGGTFVNGGLGASTGKMGGGGLDGFGGRTSANYTETLPTSPSAGRGRSNDALSSSSTAGGGTMLLHRLIGENLRIPGAGGGFSDFVSGNCYRAGGGGSMYASGGDVLAPTPSAISNIAAEGIGQGGYGVCITSSDLVGASGGGEACYRVPITVLPGETLTITVPGRGSSTMNSQYTYSSSGGPGFGLLEWEQ